MAMRPFGGVEGGPVGRGVFTGELGQEGGIIDKGTGPLLCHFSSARPNISP